MQNVSTPDAAYRAFWIWWSVGAVTAAAVLLIAARFWLVNPIIRSQRESAGRIVRAIETKACR